MTVREKAAIHKALEKKWYQSKKFLAFLLLLLFMSAFVGCLVYWRLDFRWQAAAVLWAIIFTMGIVTLFYVDRQARIDKITRGMILADSAEEADATRKIMMILDEEAKRKI